MPNAEEPSMAYDAPPNWLDRELVLEFFWKFSAFECALKREGFLRPVRNKRTDQNKAAQPDWDRFGKSIRGRFQEVRAEGFQSELHALKNLSPQRQVVKDGRLGWDPIQRRNDESDEEFSLQLVKTVRNNLFHGGKYPDGSIEEVARDKAILRAALGVLKGCYELHPGVARRIKEAA